MSDNGNSDNNSISWTKLFLIVIPFLFTALIGVIAFLANEIMDLKDDVSAVKDDVADLSIKETERHGELREQVGRQDVRVQILSQQIDSITTTRLREESEP